MRRPRSEHLHAGRPGTRTTGRHVAGGEVLERSGGRVHGGEEGAGQGDCARRYELRRTVGDVGERGAGGEQRRRQRVDLRHVGDGGDAVAGDVTQDDAEATIGKRRSRVPVTAHLDVALGRSVAGRHVDVGDLWQRLRHPILQILDQLVLDVVERGSLERLAAQAGHREQRRHDGVVDDVRALPHRGDHPERPPIDRFEREGGEALTALGQQLGARVVDHHVRGALLDDHLVGRHGIDQRLVGLIERDRGDGARRALTRGTPLQPHSVIDDDADDHLVGLQRRPRRCEGRPRPLRRPCGRC